MSRPEVRAVIADWDDCYVITRGPVGIDGPMIKLHKELAENEFGWELTDEILDLHWGSGLRAELPQFYGVQEAIGDTPEAEAVYQKLYGLFEAYKPRFPKPLQEDALEFHRMLGESGILRGLVSSHVTPSILNEMETAGLDSADFIYIHGSDVVPNKPDPRAFEEGIEILESRGITREEIMAFGDSLSEARTAREVGVRFTGVTTGRVSAEDFEREGFEAERSLSGLGVLIMPEASAYLGAPRFGDAR